MRIASPIPTGSGAVVVHRYLEAYIPDYRVIAYNPRYEYVPFLMRRLDLRKSDVIHTIPDYAIFHARKNIPLILTFHNYLLDSFMYPYSSLLQRMHYATDLRMFTHLAVKKANIVTAVSQFTANLVQQDLGFEGEITVIPNGIDSSVFQPYLPAKKRRAFRVLFSGNLTRRKGGMLLPNIARQLDSKIHITCTSGLRGRDLALEADNIKMLGKIEYSKMPELYHNVDALLMPTVREGFGLAVAEAMACGLPIVATDCSTMPELVDHGKGGFLCPLGDASAFARKINLLAQSPELCREMGQFNRAKVEKFFTVERMVRDYQELFAEVESG